MRILMVDDDKSDRQLFRRTLEKAFLDKIETIDEIGNKDQFEAALDKGNYDLVLTDYQMRGFNGLNIIDSIRGRGLDTPIIMLTGTGTEEVAIEAMKRGVDDYVLKSLNHIKRLPSTVERALERVETQRNKRKTEKMLRRYEQMVSTTNDLMAFVDTGYTYHAVNQKYCDAFDTSTDSVISRKLADITGDCHFLEIDKSNIDRCLQGEPVSYHSWVDLPGLGKRHLDMSYNPCLDSHGQVEGVVISIRDMTQYKRLEDELRELNLELEQRVEKRTKILRETQQELIKKERLATLGQLMATVSHELRNPLASMRPSLYVIRKKINSDDPDVLNAIARLERSVGRCDRIIEQMVDLTRSNSYQPRMTLVDKWLGSVLDELTVPDGIRVQREFIVPGLNVSLDPDRLRQAVVNIYDNACHAMHSDNAGGNREARGTLTVITQATEKCLEIIFNDTGHGISAEILPDIFEPLYSSKSFGVGLGLTIVKDILVQHGGDIEIDTLPGQWTSVKVWIPLS